MQPSKPRSNPFPRTPPPPGAVCGSAAFIHSLMGLTEGPLMLLGATLDPRSAAELSLRLPTLACRFAEHSRRALALATR